MAVGGQARSSDAGVAALQATVTQAAADLQTLILELEGAGTKAVVGRDTRDLDTRARDAAAYLNQVVAQHAKATSAGDSAGKAAAVRNKGRLESLERRLRTARRTAAHVRIASDRDALLGAGGGGKRRGKEQAAVSETLRAAKSQLSGNIDSGLEALKQLKEDHDKMKKVDETFGGLETELDAGTSILTKFRSRDCMDRLYIGLALAVYCFVVAWIIYRRLGLHRIVYLLNFASESLFRLLSAVLPFGGSDGGGTVQGTLQAGVDPGVGPPSVEATGHTDL